jgi:hypothetical protein
MTSEDLPRPGTSGSCPGGRSGGNGCLAEQDPLAVPSSVVTRLAIEPITLPAALGQAPRPRARGSSRELAIRSLPVKESHVLFQPARSGRFPARAGAWTGRRRRTGWPSGRAPFGWSSMLGLRWIGGRLDVQPRAHPVRPITAVQSESAEQATAGHVGTPLRSGFGLRTLAR